MSDGTLEQAHVGHSLKRMSVRPLPLSLHGPVELLFGLLTLVAPFALGFSPAATVVAVVAGVLVVGLSLSLVDEGAVQVSAHHSYDFGLALGLFAAGALVGLVGDAVAAAYLLAAAAAHLALNLLTKYSAR